MITPLSARALGYDYPDGTSALNAVNFVLPPGGFISIVGPSGCGKSTLLRLAAGLLLPTRGQLDRPAARCGFVFQFPTLLPWRTLAQNVALPLELEPAAGHSVGELLERVGLSARASAYPRQLSGGMQMRAAVARALVTRPRLMLLDEPFAALDEITRQKLNEELLSLWEADRWSALFVTHSVSEAVFLSERVLVMSPRPGRIVSEFAVPFPHPRRAELRAAPEFAGLCGRISACLREIMP